MKNLSEKYLPQAQFKTIHSVVIEADTEDVYPFLETLDFKDARVSQFLFKLRGIPVPEGMTLAGLEKINFVLLEKVKNEGLILGLIGQFWKANGNLQHFAPNEFIGFNDRSFAKAVWYFHLKKEKKRTRVITETRIECLNTHTYRKFKGYWMFIKPFSGFIRLEILKSLKRNVINYLENGKG